MARTTHSPKPRRRIRSSRSCGRTSRCRKRRTTGSTDRPTAPSAPTCSPSSTTAGSIFLTIVAETAFTNTLFVAMPAEAAANGDYLLPTVFHSVQSDESRHISNGYATLLMALSDESNHQLLQRDLRYAWWNNHRVVDAAIGTFIEYGTKDRRKEREAYSEMWRRWIYADYYPSYLVPLETYA